MVNRDLEEVNGCFDCYRGEIDHLKMREKELKKKVEELGGFVLGATHEAEVFKTRLDRMEDNVCKCGCTPSEVGEELSLQRRRLGQNCPMRLSKGASSSC